MLFEVERKFRVQDVNAVSDKLVALEAVKTKTIAQADTYYAHPARDFSNTDEALRVRQVGESAFLTYKGPKVDATTKTRRELEIPLVEGEKTASQFNEILTALGFHPVATVHKRRTIWSVSWQERIFEVAIDSLDRLGEFVEIEITADDSQVSAMKSSMNELANELGLANDERRSYLELVLELN